jgi:membrane protease YdiL (CAAX protease family)
MQKQKTCFSCDRAIAVESRFCKYCGSVQNTEETEQDGQKWNNLKQVALFFIFEVVICACGSFINYFKKLNWSIGFDVTLAIVAVTFFCDKWSKNKYLLRWRSFSVKKLIFYCAFAITCSLIVHDTVTWLNRSLFSEEFSYYAFYQGYSYAKELTIFFVAIMPALFEELGYRGFLLEKLLQIVDKKQAIFICGFIFAIMHMSFISLFWLLPFGLLLAYVRIKEDTLWYSIFMHFSFNITACIIEILAYNHR